MSAGEYFIYFSFILAACFEVSELIKVVESVFFFILYEILETIEGYGKGFAL